MFGKHYHFNQQRAQQNTAHVLRVPVLSSGLWLKPVLHNLIHRHHRRRNHNTASTTSNQPSSIAICIFGCNIQRKTHATCRLAGFALSEHRERVLLRTKRVYRSVCYYFSTDDWRKTQHIDGINAVTTTAQEVGSAFEWNAAVHSANVSTKLNCCRNGAIIFVTIQLNRFWCRHALSSIPSGLLHTVVAALHNTRHFY